MVGTLNRAQLNAAIAGSITDPLQQQNNAAVVRAVLGLLINSQFNLNEDQIGIANIQYLQQILTNYDSRLSELLTQYQNVVAGLVWQPAVPTFADLATSYPDAVEGWASSVNADDKIYRYDGVAWVPILNSIFPEAFSEVVYYTNSYTFTLSKQVKAITYIHIENFTAANSTSTAYPVNQVTFSGYTVTFPADAGLAAGDKITILFV